MADEEDKHVDRGAATTPLRPDDILQSLRGALASAQAETHQWKDKAEDLAAENATLAARLRAVEDAQTRALHDLDQLKQQVADKLGELGALVGAGNSPGGGPPGEEESTATDTAAPSSSAVQAFEPKPTVMQGPPAGLVPPSVSLASRSELPPELQHELGRSSLPDFEDDGTVEVHAQVARTTLDSEAVQSPTPMPSISSDTDPEGNAPPKR